MQPVYPSTFWGLVEQAARDWPDQVLVADDYGRSMTGVELRDACLRVAAGLAAEGVKSGTVVSWQLPTRIEALVTMAALARLGAVQNPIIPILRDREVTFIVGHIGTEVLIVPETWRDFDHGRLARDLGASHGVHALVADYSGVPDSGLGLPTADPVGLPPPPTRGDEVRWIYFSSGTTADPKGVRHTDATVMAGATGTTVNAGIGPDDVDPVAFPVTHIGGSAMFVSALTTGMRMLLFDAFDPVVTPGRMAAAGATLLGSAVPFFLAYIAAQEAAGASSLYPHLRACLGGGAPLPAEIGQRVRDVLRVAGVHNGWGLTEFPVATFPPIDAPPHVLDHTVGPAVPGVSIRVVGAAEEVLPVGSEGELRLKGPQCFIGYVDASLDADAFDADGWYRTGDLGLVDDEGCVHITGRIKDVIIRNAENLSAQEIEEVIFRMPSVADAAVIGVADPRVGERVCAVIVPAAGASVALEEVTAACQAAGLARQKWPERLEIVPALPRNPMGKVLKRVLKDQIR